MKAFLLSLSLSFLSASLVAGEPVECSRTKRSMEVLCGDFFVKRCELFRDCFIRKDSCGKGGAPKNAGECSELNDCHKALHDQYPQNFTESKACRYTWYVDEDDSSKNKCQVKYQFGLNEMVCPGNFALGNVFINSIDPDVDAETMFDSSLDGAYNCSNLRGDFKAKLIRCERIRERFKNDCMVADSEEDKVAYEEAKPPKCGFYENFESYANKKTMPLDVRLNSVNDSSRGGRDEVEDSNNDSQDQTPSARSR